MSGRSLGFQSTGELQEGVNGGCTECPEPAVVRFPSGTLGMRENGTSALHVEGKLFPGQLKVILKDLGTPKCCEITGGYTLKRANKKEEDTVEI